MGANVTPRRLALHNPSPVSVVAPKGGARETTDEWLARTYGGTPAGWHSRQYGHHPVNILFAQILAARLKHDPVSGAAWLAPADAVLAGVEIVKLDAVVAREAHEADHREDLTLFGFALAVEAGTVTRNECDRMIGDLDREIAAKMKLRASVAAHRSTL